MADETSATENEVGPEDAISRDATKWLDMIVHAEKRYQTYQKKCDNIDKLYADIEKLSNSSVDREFQIFWANLEVLKPSIYAKAPVPVVVPRFKDRKPLSRHASELLERTLITSFEVEDIDSTMKLVRDDLAANARGVLWPRYESYAKPDGSDQEKVCYDHIDRKDFLHGVARKWKEVPWVARRVWLTRKEGLRRFPGEEGKTSPWLGAEFKAREPEQHDKEDGFGGDQKAAVWEIWHKALNLVIWVTPGVHEVLDMSPPHLQLDGFFPCPRPAYATLERGTLCPVPDFLYYKDQVEEINELTARISALAESLRMRGFYAAGQSDVGDAIEAAIKLNDNNAILVPVSNFAALGGAGLKDSIVWLPVREVAEVIASLVELRRQLIDDVYQITGLSDIMRGETDANETLGAQQIKSQYGSVRIRDKQEELVRVARDATRIAAEIMAENFSPQTLLAMSQVDDLPSDQAIQQQIAEIKAQLVRAAQDPQMIAQAQQNPQMVEQVRGQAEQQIKQLTEQITIEKVMTLLREQRIRPFVLDIETDSTIRPDEDAEKQRRTEFLTALGGIMTQIGPLVAENPEAAPFSAEVLKFAVAPFRAGRELEGVIEEFAEKMKGRAQQPQPNPEAIKAEAEAEKVKAETAEKTQDMQRKAAEGQQAAAFAEQKHAAEMRLLGLQIERAEAEIERVKAQTRQASQPRPSPARQAA